MHPTVTHWSLMFKYKPIKGNLNRNDLNQILVYGLAYRSPKVLVVHPMSDGGVPGLRKTGVVGGITVYLYAFDISSESILKQETTFTDKVGEVIFNR